MIRRMKSEMALAGLLLAGAALSAAPARADEFVFRPAPQTDINRVYRVNRLTGEMGACQYALKTDTVGITQCYTPGEGAGPQNEPGDYDLVPSSHEREGGIFRVNRRTGDMSICYVLPPDTLVCTPQAR